MEKGKPRGVRRASPGSPFLKWAGGKARLLADFEPLYPPAFAAYHEPFLGAGAVFFHQRARGHQGPVHLSDGNGALVETFLRVRDDVAGLMKQLRELAAAHSDEEYYQVRERFNAALPGDPARAAMFIYLNKTGFNGLYRVNAKGRFNVPLGRYDRPVICDPPVLLRAAEVLRGTTIEQRDFASVFERASRGDFVYLDPPYDPLSATASFTSYGAGGFGRREQERLAELFGELDRSGVQVMLSNHDTPLVRELYGDPRYDYRVVARVGRAINSRAERRSIGVAEVVVRNYTT